MKYVGAHVSSSGGVENSPLNANQIEAKAFALFVKNQRQWIAPPLTDKNIVEFKNNCEIFGYKKEYILPHDSYLINLGNPDEEKRKKSLSAFIDEIKRCEQLGLLYLNFHPGSHLGLVSEYECIELIIDSLNKAISETEYLITVIENTAGQGGAIGYKFEHLSQIINGIDDKNRIGVCLDTCHTYTSGYDITSKESYEKTFNLFESVVGFKYLKALHLNDSKKELASKVDRHDSIGKGLMGYEVWKLIMNDKRFDDIPLILETIDETIWKEEIKFLYSLEN
ncbi:MAG TPA: deoxyribonuclease IV [Spirochaetota bacterium]|nr:deoxyribonuclease IV [Spirochaetota bacterium]